MSIGRVEVWAGFLRAAAVWLGAFAAAAAIGALIFTNKDAKNKHDELQRYQAAAAERAGKLEKEAEEARLEVARLTTPRWENFNRQAFRDALKRQASNAGRIVISAAGLRFVYAGDGY